jgi:hypothetical protein
MGYIPRLQQQYASFKGGLKEELGLENVMETPKVEKL